MTDGVGEGVADKAIRRLLQVKKPVRNFMYLYIFKTVLKVKKHIRCKLIDLGNQFEVRRESGWLDS